MNNPISPSKRGMFWVVSLTDLVIFALAGLVCWIIGYRSWIAFGIALMIAGSGLILIGVLEFVLAPGSSSSRYGSLLAQSQAPGGPGQPNKLLTTYSSGWSFALLMGLAGLIALGGGMLIMKLAEL